jgi:hypothetical protein
MYAFRANDGFDIHTRFKSMTRVDEPDKEIFDVADGTLLFKLHPRGELGAVPGPTAGFGC